MAIVYCSVSNTMVFCMFDVARVFTTCLCDVIDARTCHPYDVSEACDLSSGCDYSPWDVSDICYRCLWDVSDACYRCLWDVS